MTSLEKLKKLDIQTALLFEKLESETGNKLDYSKNKWSILQILYHVWLAEISSEKYIRTSIQVYLRDRKWKFSYLPGLKRLWKEYFALITAIWN